MGEMRIASGLCLALDFGGTKLAAGLVNWRTGEVLRQARCATVGSRGARGQIADMLGLVEGELGLAGAGRPAIDAVGVSFGGPVDTGRGIVLQSHHVEGWEGLPLAAELGATFHCPVYLENDANAVALGEYRYGAGRGARTVVYITVSTGIGGGIVLEGELWRGSHGVAGEVGHMVVRPGGPLCTCGNRGCLESLASGPSIARRAREAIAAGGGSRTAPTDDSRATDGGGSQTAPTDDSCTAGRGGSRTAPTIVAIAGSEEAITAEHVFRAARAGDPLAAQVVASAAEDLGLAIAMLASIVDPERVILGGGVAKAGEQLLAPVRAAFARHAFPLLAGRVAIVQAAAIDEGGLLGAAALVAQAHR